MRPAMTIVKLLQEVSSTVLFTYNDYTVNAKSIISLLFLSAASNAIIEVCIEGEDAESVMENLSEGFSNGFLET